LERNIQKHKEKCEQKYKEKCEKKEKKKEEQRNRQQQRREEVVQNRRRNGDIVEDFHSKLNEIAIPGPNVLCGHCGISLYKDDFVWTKEVPLSSSLQPFTNMLKKKSNATNNYMSSCASCHKNTPEGLDEFMVVDPIPECINALQNYSEKRSLSLGAFFCRTFHPDRRKASFAHVGGDLNCGMYRSHVIT
jgi:hypothetical protein